MSRASIKRLLGAGLLMAVALPARAELSPMLYLCWARQAPEALQVQVLNIETEPVQGEPELIARVASLRVTAVRRSADGLKPGAQIRIRQIESKHKPAAGAPMPGPAPMPSLQQGQALSAFLEPDGQLRGFYQPAARGQSFSPYLWADEADPAQRAAPSC
ncbi:hypothetical protein [Roseateles violae]|uniref:Uncharacterized protein n=1 Tax=Roseateles violae TaxID=3058042 RepID=A0ABT8DTJ4_9BURK|nr:hypothetical protein [Pelomonas sp. PFR6]MDN3919634.1 hypothetical protein [Pelomonas sp. PFR6]